ncbi:hypothetical protein H2200_011258 [Cladophialophora chaetospira]|uniref:Uncharacterized protein n=1 Tax=Cladophialophora chaetospira TaxID=386627 RepID=A0AA38X0A0_9EURO|nr:hypothetical protein H2200_011258 [Cladophialophora chaetospira]
MSQSPAKRRKLDNTQSRTSNDSAQDEIQPTTPTRASYLSPTKSSLARSHPHLVSRSTRRPATEPRGKALRDEILGGRSEPPAPNTIAQIRPSQGLDGTDDTVDVQINGTASRADSTHLVANTNPLEAVDHERPPLKERQPAQSKRRERSISSDGPPPHVFTPKLVSKKSAAPRPVDRALSGEPELPPTPVELGLIAVPERPRGLASSSSPRGSKMSSGSRRRKTRSSGPVTSSPLKPAAAAPVRTENADTEDDVQQAPESEPEGLQGDEEESTELREQGSTLQSLREQVDQLTRENEQLQEAIHDDDKIDEALLSMVRESAMEDGFLQQPTASVRAEDRLTSYLTLFTPANLQLKTRTETTSMQERTKILHILQIQAPSPWLPNALSCAFEVTVDAENVQIENIELKDAMMAVTRRTKSTRAEIYRWVYERLEDPLHRLDVSGMIWAMGRWFNAAVERSKAFHWINLEYNRSPSKSSGQKDEKDSELTRETCIELARFLDSTQNTAIDADVTITSGGKKFKKKLMLNWQISLDWAGGLVSDIQISTSGIPPKAEPGLKTIFCTLFPKVGIKAAFQHVWSLMHSDDADFSYESEKGMRKRKR